MITSGPTLATQSEQTKMGCCQVTFIIIAFLFIGFLLGVWLDKEMQLNGIDGLWQKFIDLFRAKEPKLI